MTNRKNRWASKEECLAYMLKHRPTGLTRLSALDYLQGYGAEKLKDLERSPRRW